MTTKNSKPLALSPPVIDSSSFVQQENQLLYKPLYFAAPTQGDELIGTDDRIIAKKKPDTQKNCSFKDKLDRKYLLAYEWGRSKLSVDIDGINLKSTSTKAFRIEYKIKLQPEKTKKQLCRYPSNWQGLIGSSYNEFVIKGERINLRDIIKF